MYCVMMGDIINSRGLDDEVRERVTQAAKSAFDRINTKYRGAFLANFGLVRGDSFEGVLLAQHYAPQIMQDIIKAFYRVEKTLVRISVVMGQLTVTSPDRNEVDGPAFTDVMAALAKIKERGSTHWLQVSFDIGTLGQSLISSQFGLITALTERWTDKQREICWTAEEIEGHEEYPKDIARKQELYRLVANKLGSTPAIIKKQLNAASYDMYRQAWDGITSYLIEIDEQIAENKSIIQDSYIPYLNMGRRKLDQHSFDEALPLLEKSLSLALDTLSENDLQLVPIYTCLADAYTVTMQYREAENAIKKAIALQKESPKTHQLIETLNALATVHYCQFEYDNAMEAFEEALAVARDMLSHPHPYWGQLYNNIALVYADMCDYETALSYYEKALAFEEDALDSSINYAVGLSNIADCYNKMQKYEEAVLYAEKALKIFESDLPPNHEYITDTREDLAIFKKNQKGE